MKSRRMAVGKMENICALYPEDDGIFFFGTNLSSVTPRKIVSLSDNSSMSDNSDENSNSQALGLPTVMIMIVILLAFVFIMGVLYTYIRLYNRNRTSRWTGGVNNDGQDFEREDTRGLERTVIESFPVYSFKVVKGLKAQTKESGCSVCLGDFEDEEMVKLLPKCSHAFHGHCIDMWLWSHTTCPMCRTSLVPADDSNPTPTELDVVPPNTPRCSFMAVQEPSCSELDGSMDDAEFSRKGVFRAKSERWVDLVTMNRTSLFRTFSERYVRQ